MDAGSLAGAFPTKSVTVAPMAPPSPNVPIARTGSSPATALAHRSVPVAAGELSSGRHPAMTFREAGPRPKEGGARAMAEPGFAGYVLSAFKFATGKRGGHAVIELKCQCGRTVFATEDQRGQNLQCPHCQGIIPVPAGIALASPPPVPKSRNKTADGCLAVVVGIILLLVLNYMAKTQKAEDQEKRQKALEKFRENLGVPTTRK